MSIGLYVLAGLLALGALMTVGSVGKPRKPVTPGIAVAVAMVNAGWFALLVMAARRLS